MIYKLYLTRDSTIYKCDENKNTGMDPQLILQSYYDITPYTNTLTKSATRILLDFEYQTNQKYIYYQSQLQSASILLYMSNLQLETGEPYTINCYVVKKQWQQGIGLDAYKYYYDGVTWKYNSKSSEWTTPGGEYDISLHTANSFTHKNYEYITIPINIPTPPYAAPYGYLLKFDDNYENLTSSNVGYMSFYSTKTHTIYSPSVLLYIDDYIYTTGSLEKIDETKQIQLSINNIKSGYMVDQIVQFNITCKNIIYDRTWSASYWTQPKYILPNTITCSYRIWDVTDLKKQVFINFNQTYTRISCNSSVGNYFTLDMSQFYENRIYQIQLMTHDSAGIKKIYSNKYTFKIK